MFIALLAARSKILSQMKKNKTDMTDGDILSNLVAYGSDQVALFGARSHNYTACICSCLIILYHFTYSQHNTYSHNEMFVL